MKSRIAALFFFMTSLILSGLSQAGDAPTPPESSPLPRVVIQGGDTARFGSLISVYLDAQKYGEVAGDNKTPVLYLDKLPIKGLLTTKIPGENAVSFQLNRTNDSSKEWTAILKRTNGYSKAMLEVGIGLDQGETIKVGTIKFEVISAWFWGWLAISILIALAIVFCPSMLKDSTSDGTQPAFFSLGRIQMAFWFFLVTSAFLFIWLATGDMAAIPNSALALIGISAGTGLGAVAIGTATPTQSSVASCSINCGLLNDIITDPSGQPSFHRLQMLIWTLVLGIIFIVGVATSLSMPDFPNELLALMGISSGAYLGFKFPENANAGGNKAGDNKAGDNKAGNNKAGNDKTGI